MRGTWIYALAVGAVLLAGCNVGTGWNGKYVAKGDPYEAVVPGMTEREVVALMGRPVKRTRVQGEGGDNAVVLQLRWMSQNHLITIFIIDGVVAGKSRV